MKTNHFEKCSFAFRRVILAIAMSLVMVLAFTTVVQAQTIYNDQNREEYYRDLFAFMNQYVSPEYHLKEESTSTPDQKVVLKQVAQDITKNCTADYEKMWAIASYAAENFYYDYVYYNYYLGDFGKLAYFPYDVYLAKTAVCSGYANFCKEMLCLIDVPCMLLYGYDHVFNAAYDKDSKRWVIFDSTWMSNNERFLNKDGTEIWNKGESINDYYFDITPEFFRYIKNHEIYNLNGISIGDYIYKASFTYENDIYGLISAVSTEMSLEGVNNIMVNAVIPEDVFGMDITNYSDFFFRGNTSLKSVVFPVNLKSVAFNCFRGCTSLEKVVFKGNPERILAFAFADCTSLKDITIPMGIDEVSYGCFYNCTSLVEIEIPEGVKFIDSCAFYNCKNLAKIVIPNSVTKIDPLAFSNIDNTKFVIYCESGSYAESFAKSNGYRYVIVKSASDDYVGLKFENDTWYYYNHGRIDKNFTGLTNYNNNWWYVKEGKLNKSWVGLTVGNYCVYSVKNGQLDSTVSGLKYCTEDGNWYYMKNGKQEKSYTGLVYYGSDWWYVTNGKLDKSFKGITSMNGKLWFIRNGKISRENGITKYDGKIYWITNGAVDTNVTDLKYNGGDGKWYYFRQGVVDWTYNTLAYVNNQWWYVNNGVLDKSFTGLVEFRGQLWYVTEGKLNKEFVGTYFFKNYYWLIENGIATKYKKVVY